MMLWHDMHLIAQGPIVAHLHLHFAQRWAYAFTLNPRLTRSLSLPPPLARLSLFLSSAELA